MLASWFSRQARPAALAALIAFASLAGSALPAGAQGFMVKPMRMEAEPAAGRLVELPLEIRNTAADGPRVIDLRLVELSQAKDGTWRLVEPDAGEDLKDHPSARPWAELSAARVEIAPLEPASVSVLIRPPADARGAYFVGVVAETPLPEDRQGVVVRVRFLIPVIVEIAGRPVRQDVDLDDVVMAHVAAEGALPTTTAHLRVTNRGRTFSRIRGDIRVDRLADGRWRPVTTLPVSERSIIPGMTLELGGDLARRLPSGMYRLRGELSVDGRRIPAVERELAFEGDPAVTAVAFDTALVLTPALVRMEIVPGATRTATVRVENPGDEPIAVRVAAATPRALVGVQIGERIGTALSAEPWTELRPAEFTLRPRGSQNVRIVSRVPDAGVAAANYYANLTLTGRYGDGQSAGETVTTVNLVNRQVPPEIAGSVEQLAISEAEEPGTFAVEVRIANLGTVHVEPVARAYVLNPQGGQVVSQELAAEEGPLLPFGKRIFGGEVDLSELPAGSYALRAVVLLGNGREITRQHVLVVDRRDPAAGSEGAREIDVQLLSAGEEADADR